MSAVKTSQLDLSRFGVGSFVAAIPAGLLVVDCAARIVFSNRRFELLSGYPSEELLGRALAEFLTAGDTDWSTLIGASPESSDSDQPVELQREIELLRKRGVALPVAVSLSPVHIDGQPFTIVSVTDISGIRSAKDQLRSSKSRLDEAQRIAQIGSWERDLITNELFWSDEIARLFELDAGDQLDFDKLRTFTHPEDQPAAARAYEAALKDRKQLDMEYRIIVGSGTVKFVRVCCEFTYDANGRAARVIGTFQDVTRRRQSEDESRSFRAAMDASPDGIYFTDLATNRFIYVNRTVIEYTGLTEEELLRSGPQDLLGQSLEEIRRGQQEALTAGSSGTVSEFHLADADNNLNWFETRRHAIELDGRTILVSSVRNITEAKLRQREMQRFRAAMDASSDMIHVTDRATLRFIYANKRAVELSGFSEEELLEKGPQDLFQISRAEVDALFDAAIAAGEAGTVTQMRTKSREGIKSVVEVRRKALCLNDQWIIVTISQDIGLRIKAERELKALHEQLEQRVTERTMQLEIEIEQRKKASQAKNKFLASMSHELRTPLNSILGFAQLLEIDESEGLRRERQQQHLRRILTSGEQLLQLITDLLELNNLDEGRMLFQRSEVSALEVIEDCLNQIRFRAKERRVTLVNLCTTQASLPRLWSDSLRLKQVLMGLLSNAINYNVPGGTVTVFCSENTPYMLRINVADSGGGIPEESKKDIFVPFERIGREAGAIEGTGIGLSIAKRIIELLGGKIGFESKLGEGSTFWIEVPVNLEQQASLARVASDLESERAPVPVKEATVVNSKVVLYIEDDPENMSLMQQILERIPKLKIEMIAAHNAELGIDLAVQRQPDLILMDINLPTMSGNEAIVKLKQMQETRQIPVIAVSADATQHSIERAMRNGFESYITKPIKVMRLRESVIKTLGL